LSPNLLWIPRRHASIKFDTSIDYYRQLGVSP
jgi:hypothetical protein